MTAVTAQIGRDHYKTVLGNHRSHQLVADEPEAHGGTNQGFAPDELLASALATCAIITMRMYADRKGWPLDSIELEVGFERHENGSRFTKRARFTGPLSAEQQQRLLAIGDKCPVHKTLSNPIEISSVIA